MTNAYASNMFICFPVRGKYESVCDCWAVLSYLEKSLKVEVPKTNPAAVTLVHCTVKRADIHSSKHCITTNAAVCSYKAIILRYLNVLTCCSWTILRIFWIRRSWQVTRRQRESTFRVKGFFTSCFWTISSVSLGCVLQTDRAVRRRKYCLFYFGQKNQNHFSWLSQIVVLSSAQN